MFAFPREVNERAARLVAAGVATLLVCAFALRLWWIVALLAVGFVLRVGWGPRFSVLGRAAVALARKLWPPVPVEGTPKQFAQAIGAAFTLSATALFTAGFAYAGWILAGIIVLFASLEAGLGFCMGCWVYARLFNRA